MAEKVADQCRRELDIEIPLDVVQKREEEIAVVMRQRLRLPGFRPGKAPLSVVRQRYRDDIRSELMHELVPEQLAAQTKEHNWEIIGKPAISDVQYSADSPLKFKATFEVLPEFELQDYSDIMVEVADTTVSDDEVQQTLLRIQEEQATYVNVEEPRPLADGDYASIGVREVSTAPEQPEAKSQELLCEIGGERTRKEFTENLRGASLGEERTFAVSYPEGGSDPEIAGKSVTYHVKVLGVKKKVLPELDDDLARELGEYETLDAVRQRIREDLESVKRSKADNDAKEQLRHKLAELHIFPVPEGLVERQVESRLESFRRDLANRGMDPRTQRIDWGRVRAAQRDGAVEDVKGGLILRKIADANDIRVDQSEVAGEIQRIAAAARQAPEVVEAHLTQDGGLDRIKSRLRLDKTLGFVLQNVQRIQGKHIAGEDEV